MILRLFSNIRNLSSYSLLISLRVHAGKILQRNCCIHSQRSNGRPRLWKTDPNYCHSVRAETRRGDLEPYGEPQHSRRIECTWIWHRNLEPCKKTCSLLDNGLRNWPHHICVSALLLLTLPIQHVTIYYGLHHIPTHTDTHNDYPHCHSFCVNAHTQSTHRHTLTQNEPPAWITKLESYSLLWRQSLLPHSYLTCTPLIIHMMNCTTFQQHSCDIFTWVVDKHRCARVISGFKGRMSREGSLLFALMNHAVTSFCRSNFTLATCTEWASARISCLIMMMWLSVAVLFAH